MKEKETQSYSKSLINEEKFIRTRGAWSVPSSPLQPRTPAPPLPSPLLPHSLSFQYFPFRFTTLLYYFYYNSLPHDTVRFCVL